VIELNHYLDTLMFRWNKNNKQIYQLQFLAFSPVVCGRGWGGLGGETVG
jgi:hypothetical protein